MTRYVAILVAALVPAVASAQETAQTWPGQAKAGSSTVYVLDDTGTETSGRLLRLDPDSLVLRRQHGHPVVAGTVSASAAGGAVFVTPDFGGRAF